MSGRQLPPWMKSAEEGKAKKKKKKEPLSSSRRVKTARSVFYCMNEKELVEAAVSFLADAACEDVRLLPHRQEAEQDRDPCVETDVRPAASASPPQPVTEASDEESSGGADPDESTYVSETDLDITEVETLPYTESPQCQGHQGQRSGPVQNQRAEEEEQIHLAAEQDDDPFQLVREIFFTSR